MALLSLQFWPEGVPPALILHERKMNKKT